MRNIDELSDINPRTWLRRYRKNSVPYLIKMGIFYIVLGIILQQLGNMVAVHVIENYQAPSIPASIIIGLTSGPLEEVTFFGIPFYLSSNPLIVLGGGILWSVLHLFNTASFAISGLAYGNLLFTIPHIFYSLRTWISGKGWFAVVFHSSWNSIVLGSRCIDSPSQCSIIGSGWYFVFDILSISAVIFLCLVLYRTRNYRRSIQQ